MKTNNPKKESNIKDKQLNGDILNVVEQFISYFEDIDKEVRDDNSIISGKRNQK